jgi:predicted nucleic acid-binding protein
VLLDTSVLIRTLQPHHPLYSVATFAIQHLPQRGETLVIVPQNLVELWAVATRPQAANGLGLSVVSAAAQLERLKSMFFLVPETPAIYGAWERLVIEHGVTGKSSHDTRLVAVMQVHGISSILTFDRTDFHDSQVFEWSIPRMLGQDDAWLLLRRRAATGHLRTMACSTVVKKQGYSPLCCSIFATNAVQPVW